MGEQGREGDGSSVKLKELAACMRRAEKGEKLTLGFFGGSITQGAGASSEESCYAFLVYQWWKENFPQAEFIYVNGGIGGTTSHFGAARAEEDLLRYRPDVAVVDFSVNDEAEPFFRETYEGLIRKILSAGPRPAVLILNNARYDDGSSAQKIHGEVAEHYGLPRVSIRDTVWQEIKKGVFRGEELSADGLHPNDRGHRLVAGELIRVLEAAKELAGQGALFTADEGDEAGEETGTGGDTEIRREMDVLPAPMTANAYEGAWRIDARNGGAELAGFRKDTDEQKEKWDFFRNGWIGRKKGDRLELTADCSCLAVQYRKTSRGKAPAARLILDGDEASAFLLDGNFDEDWDCLYLQTLLHHGPKCLHHIQVELVEEGAEDAPPFYLLSFICA